MARGLVVLLSDRIGPLAHFTDTGYAALRMLTQDRQALNPPHLRPPAPGARVGAEPWLRSSNVHRMGDKAVGKAVGIRSATAVKQAHSPLPRIRAVNANRSGTWPADAHQGWEGSCIRWMAPGDT